MPNGTYGGVRGKETKVGQKNFRFPTYSILLTTMGMILAHVNCNFVTESHGGFSCYF